MSKKSNKYKSLMKLCCYSQWERRILNCKWIFVSEHVFVFFWLLCRFFFQDRLPCFHSGVEKSFNEQQLFILSWINTVFRMTKIIEEIAARGLLSQARIALAANFWFVRNNTLDRNWYLKLSGTTRLNLNHFPHSDTLYGLLMIIFVTLYFSKPLIPIYIVLNG